MSVYWRIAVAVLFIVFATLVSSRAEDSRWENHDSILRAKMDENDTSLFWYSIDQKIVCDSGTIFVVRTASAWGAMDSVPLEELNNFPKDTMYGFFAVADSPAGPEAWNFGMIRWGMVTDRYFEVMAGDSLHTLLAGGAWWESPELWNWARTEQNYQLAEKNFYGHLRLLDSAATGLFGDSPPNDRIEESILAIEALTGIGKSAGSTTDGDDALHAADIEQWLDWWYKNDCRAKWDYENERIVLDSMLGEDSTDSDE